MENWKPQDDPTESLISLVAIVSRRGPSHISNIFFVEQALIFYYLKSFILISFSDSMFVPSVFLQ